MSQLPCSEQAGNPGERQHRAVEADEQLAILAVPAQADPAAHVALEGDADLVGAYPSLEQSRGREPHHDLGAADQGEGGPGVETCPCDERRHQTDPAGPRRCTVVDGDQHLHPQVLPTLQLLGEEQILGAAGAVEQDHPPIALPVVENLEHRWTKWRQTDSPGDEYHVPADAVGYVPAGAVGPTDAYQLADRGAGQSVRDSTDVAHRVMQRARHVRGTCLLYTSDAAD